MYKGNKILALIPARSGSKRIPNKNIRQLCGKPLIAWSIEQASGARYIDKIVVSTESPFIASIARRYGVDIPFLRPNKLATDKAKSLDVILHTLNFYESKKDIFDIVVLLQPTSPLRKSSDINKAIEKLLTSKAKSIVSVCKEEHSPLWSVTLTKNNKIGPFLKKNTDKQNGQSLPVFYRINGAIYVANINYLKQNKGFFGKSTFAYIMPPERSVDIDTTFDFKIADFLKQ
jgi:N-acylneuraminate cytidylyltransferase/CMP-N,N'-diacetyllegionaminic acid synthase